MRRVLLWLLCLAGLLPATVIYQGGRIKPLDSFAREALYQMSGKTSLGGRSALEWVDSLVDHPGSTDSVPFFRVNHSEVVALLHLDSGRRYHSYREFGASRSLLMQYAERTDTHPVTREMIHLEASLSLYESLRAAKDYERPLFEVRNRDWKRLLKLDPATPLFSAADLRAAMVSLDSVKRSAALLRFADSLRMDFAVRGEGDVWRIFPDPSGDTTVLVSPWTWLAESPAALPGPAVLPPAQAKRMAWEVAYHRIHLPLWSLVLAGLSVLMSLLALGVRQGRLWVVSAALLKISGACLLGTLVWRSLITGRPPLGSLYEVLLLVSLLLVVSLGFSFVRWREHRILLPGGILVFALLFFAENSLAGGDSFRVLPALLQSSFWLTLHVFTMAVGYSGVILSGLAGHAILMGYATRRPSAVPRETLESFLYGTLAFGLFFTVAGTLLGGFWADVAWGRFWGWDPKENAALFVILWGMIALHLRSGHLIARPGFTILTACGIPVVGLSWFGVNLLGTGLHSYGFEQGTALSLAVFIAADLLLIAVLAFRGYRRRNSG